MVQITNPLQRNPALHSGNVVITSNVRYRLQGGDLSLDNLLGIIRQSEIVSTEHKEDGTIHYVSRGKLPNGKEINLVWRLDGGESLRILNVFIEPIDF
jgi:hypothetical protein